MRFLFLILLFYYPLTRAHHPTEGQLTLSELLKEAEANNLELKTQVRLFESKQRDLQLARSSFYPEIKLNATKQNTEVAGLRYSADSQYASAEWNLYRGGKDSAQVDSTKLEIEFNHRQLQAFKAKVRRQVAQSYYELLYLLESQSLKNQALQLNQQQMQLALKKRESGFTSKADVLEFDLREASLKSDQQFLDQQINEQRNNLALILGRTSAEGLGVKGHLAIENRVFDKSQMTAQIQQRNIELLEAQIAERQKALAVQQVRADFLPQINLEAKYGKLEESQNLENAGGDYSVAVKLEMPLFSGLSTVSQYQGSRESYKAQQQRLLSTQRQIDIELDNVFKQFDLLAQRQQLEEKNLLKSEEYYKITVEEYRRGVKNSPDLVSATENLLQVRIRNLEYRRDFRLNELRLFSLLSDYPN